MKGKLRWDPKRSDELQDPTRCPLRLRTLDTSYITTDILVIEHDHEQLVHPSDAPSATIHVICLLSWSCHSGPSPHILVQSYNFVSHCPHIHTISHVLKLMSFSSHLIPRVLPPRYLWISSISHRHHWRWFGPGPGLLCVMSEDGTDAHWRGTIRCHLPIRVQRFLLALGQHIFGVLRS